MRLCRTGKHGDTMRDGIPIFFSSCGKENGHSWSKEKTLRDDLTPPCQITQDGGWPPRTVGKIQKSLAGCADRYSSNNCAPASVGAAFIGVQRGHPLPHFPLPLPLSLEGFPKGRNRSFAPLCRFKGVRGEIEIPPRFSLGGPGGTFSFQKRISPLASAGIPGPLREQTVLSDFQIK